MTGAEGPIDEIAVVMAMAVEAGPILDAIGAVRIPTPEHLPFLHYRAQLDAGGVTIAVNGVDHRHGVDNIATQPAVLNTYLVCHEMQPDLLITAGTAGGYARGGAEIGDVYIADRPFRYHDRRIAIPGFESYGDGLYPAADLRGVATKIGAKLGGVTTGNSLDETDVDRMRIEDGGAVCKDMEAAAVAWVGGLMGVPTTAVKSVTDIVDGEHPTEVEFAANLAVASRRLAEVLVAVLDHSLGRPLDALGTRDESKTHPS